MTIAHKKRAFQRKSDVGQFPLMDTQTPNLYRHIFPYDEVCRVEFDNQFIFIDPPEEIFITDTTFRDGQQARPPYTVEQIVDLFDMMHKLGGPNGVIRQCEFFLYSEKDKEAVTKCMDRNYRYPEITGWIRAVAADFKLVAKIGSDLRKPDGLVVVPPGVVMVTGPVVNPSGTVTSMRVFSVGGASSGNRSTGCSVTSVAKAGDLARPRKLPARLRVALYSAM